MQRIIIYSNKIFIRNKTSNCRLAHEYEKIMFSSRTHLDKDKTPNLVGNDNPTPNHTQKQDKNGFVTVDKRNTQLENENPSTSSYTPLWKKRPYLTAGGRHEMTEKKTMSPDEIELLIYNMRNTLDKHYLEWKTKNT